MKCPYRLNEIHTYNDGKTYIQIEFADCYKEICPCYETESKAHFAVSLSTRTVIVNILRSNYGKKN